MKLIFLDIDGTLVEAGSNTPPESALRAIRASQAKGNKVFLCTGRNPAMLAPVLAYGFDGMVASAGGYVTIGDEVIYDQPMTGEQLKTALDSLHRNGVFCTIEARDATYGDENLGEFLKNASGGNSEIERWRKALSESLNIRPMAEYDGRPIYKVVFMCARAEQLAGEGKTPLFFARDGQYLGTIAVADTMKEDSAQAIRELRGMGIHVVMLTGDNRRTAEAIGRQAGVNEVVAGVLPAGKEEVIRLLQE